MTLRIEDDFERDVTTFRLIGRLQAENLPDLARLLGGQTQTVILDLKEVNLVDVESVQFLARCTGKSVQLRNCSAYIQSWIAEESKQFRSTEP